MPDKTKILSKVLRVVAVLALSLVPALPMANATGPTTDEISTCAQLNTLGANSSTITDNISLTANLDCTGVNFTPMYQSAYPSGYSGIFNGNGYSISNLTINEPGSGHVALLTNLDGATVENLVLESGTITGSQYVASLAGTAQAVTISNVITHLSVVGDNSANMIGGLIGYVGESATSVIQDVSDLGSVTASGPSFPSGSYIGGLIGDIDGNDGGNVTVKRSFTAGTINAGSTGLLVGGLIGRAFVFSNTMASTINIDDSYSRSDISTAGGQEVGGLIGEVAENGPGVGATINVDRTYASGSVTGGSYVGGLIGQIDANNNNDVFTVANSFAAGAVTGNSTGGLIGINYFSSPQVATSTNNYFESTDTTQSVCVSNGISGTCTGTDPSGPNPWLHNFANPPEQSWDLRSTWSGVPGDYPILIPATNPNGGNSQVEEAGPNGGDTNGDGIDDAAQANVTSIVDPVDGKYMAIGVDSSCTNQSVSAMPESNAAVADAGYSYPAGLVSYTTNCLTPGFTATVNLYFYGVTGSGLTLRKYNAATHAYSNIPGANVSELTIGGQSVVKATYEITDGGALDSDGAANGVIVDPVGLGTLTTGAPDTGLGGLSQHLAR